MLYELPIGAFLAAFIVLLPLPWHWRARNVPMLSIIAWLFVSNDILSVNAIIWRDTIEATALVRVDITTKLEIGATLVLTTVEQRTRRRIFNLALCLGLTVREIQSTQPQVPFNN
ncbi:pheromone A receptor-domain-containing protein [Mycena galopus ATCC 62051]|nr:pheromone A receptor-domain-containing protein [Mycena galopus ATCC 62051]